MIALARGWQPPRPRMRRFEQPDLQYRVEFSPPVRAHLADLPAWLSQNIEEEVRALAELADIAPIPQVGGITDERAAPPLHLTVGEWVVTYAIERRARRLLVTRLERI